MMHAWAICLGAVRLNITWSCVDTRRRGQALQQQPQDTGRPRVLPGMSQDHHEASAQVLHSKDDAAQSAGGDQVAADPASRPQYSLSDVSWV